MKYLIVTKSHGTYTTEADTLVEAADYACYVKTGHEDVIAVIALPEAEQD